MAKQKKKSDLAIILGFAGSYKWLTYLGCALSGISQLFAFVPFVCIWFVARDLIAVAPSWSAATDIASYGWIALAFAVGSIAVYFAALMCTHLAAFRCASNIRKQTTKKLMHMPLGFFDTNASGALRRKIDGCAGQTETLLAHNLADVAGSVIMIFGTVVMLFVFDWRLGLACLAAIIVSIFALMAMMGGKGQEFMKQYMDSLTEMNKTGTEYIRGIPVVKTFQQTVYSFKAFYDSIKKYSRLSIEYTVGICRPPQVLNLSALNGLVIFLVPVAILVAPGEGNFAGFLTNFAFYAIFSALIPTAMCKLMFMAEATQMAGDAVANLREIWDAEVISAPENPKTTSEASIDFKDVKFSYDGGAQALDGVTFSVPAGATVALVGPSGGGKTTCASLVPRFWDVDEGKVEIGGVDVRDFDPKVLLDKVAFVFQTNRLFNQTLAENVRAAKPEATDDEVAAALHAAQCDDIVVKLPDGLDTMLGTGGTYLSGGEVQRVALARAILKAAPIVVLDEATAFADPENEALIQKAFSELTKNSTVLMIAHRLSTVVGADKIVVLDAGKVAEEGTHEELACAGGIYAKMWEEYNQAASWRISSDGGEQHV